MRFLFALAWTALLVYGVIEILLGLHKLGWI